MTMQLGDSGLWSKIQEMKGMEGLCILGNHQRDNVRRALTMLLPQVAHALKLISGQNPLCRSDMGVSLCKAESSMTTSASFIIFLDFYK